MAKTSASWTLSMCTLDRNLRHTSRFAAPRFLELCPRTLAPPTSGALSFLYDPTVLFSLQTLCILRLSPVWLDILSSGFLLFICCDNISSQTLILYPSIRFDLRRLPILVFTYIWLHTISHIHILSPVFSVVFRYLCMTSFCHKRFTSANSITRT